MNAAVQLRELFPFHSTAQIHDALNDGHNSVDQASEILLQQLPAKPQQPAVVTCSMKLVAPSNKQQNRSISARAGQSAAAKPSWGSLGECQPAAATTAASSSSGGSTVLPLSPQYINPRGRMTPTPPQLTDQVFPALHPGNNSNSSGRSNGLDCSFGDPKFAPSLTHKQKQQYHWSTSTAAAAPAGPIDTDGAEDAHNNSSGNPARKANRSQQRQQLAPRRSISAPSFAELIKQQQPQATEFGRPSSSMSYNRPASAAAGSSSNRLNHSPAAAATQQQQQQQPGFEQLMEQLSLLHFSSGTQVLGEEFSEDGDQSAAATAHTMCPSTPEQQMLEQHHHQQGNQLNEAPEVQTSNLSSPDVYHELRKEAIKLSSKWQKKMKRAAAAAAAGDYSSAKQLSAEGRALKAAADEAHAAAALKIEVANNTGNNAGLWELDLHGLHVNEAVNALQDRLDLLHDLVKDIMQQAQLAAAAAESSALPSVKQGGIAPDATGAGGGGSSRQQLLSQLLLLDDQQDVPTYVRQAAGRQELRVIVGKGNNSSNGEASLPRVVQQWLTDGKYKYLVRSGAIDVKLKRWGVESSNSQHNGPAAAVGQSR